ncbi:hypothetical protein EV360DRAFT_90775, partial [Lentinula raphanica]
MHHSQPAFNNQHHPSHPAAHDSNSRQESTQGTQDPLLGTGWTTDHPEVAAMDGDSAFNAAAYSNAVSTYQDGPTERPWRSTEEYNVNAARIDIGSRLNDIILYLALTLHAQESPSLIYELVIQPKAETVITQNGVPTISAISAISLVAGVKLPEAFREAFKNDATALATARDMPRMSKPVNSLFEFRQFPPALEILTSPTSNYQLQSIVENPEEILSRPRMLKFVLILLQPYSISQNTGPTYSSAGQSPYSVPQPATPAYSSSANAWSVDSLSANTWLADGAWSSDSSSANALSDPSSANAMSDPSSANAMSDPSSANAMSNPSSADAMSDNAWSSDSSSANAWSTNAWSVQGDTSFEETNRSAPMPYPYSTLENLSVQEDPSEPQGNPS